MQASNRAAARWTLAALALLLLWELAGGDLALARLAGHPDGFPLREHWFTSGVLHVGGRYAGWGMAVVLCLFVTWPAGALRQLPFVRRLQLALSALLATGFIALLKTSSGTSCPWDLQEFGGVVHYVSHWSAWAGGDGGPGRCFPAGHAGAGFAFAGGFFALRRDLPALAPRWLAAALAAGLVLGVGQQLRGAHFMSHTLWTAWICWMSGWLLDALFSRRAAVLARPLATPP